MKSIVKAGIALAFTGAVGGLGPSRAGADVTSDRGGSIVIWPKVMADGTRDTQEKCLADRVKAAAALQSCLGRSRVRALRGRPEFTNKCAAAFTAQLQKTAAASCRFLDNEDGSVTDTTTGLGWEKKDTTCPGAHCYTDQFTFGTSVTVGGTHFVYIGGTGTAFTTFLYGLNGGTSPDGQATSGCFADHCDWRVPTIEELSSLIDASQGNCGGGSGPCIDPTLGPMPTDMYAFYWSATADSMYSGLAFNVLFNTGGLGAFNFTDSGYVRAVRGSVLVTGPTPTLTPFPIP